MRKQFIFIKPKALLLFWVLLFYAGCSTVMAQITLPLFQVIHLPRKAGYSKEKLNTELAPLKDKEAVKKLLRYKNFPAETTLVLQVARPGGVVTYWTLNTSAPTDKEEARIILQSRDNESTRFYKLGGFKTFFKDTVAVLDTLSIELLIHDDAYPDDGYRLSLSCGKGLSVAPIPLHDGKLMFTQALAQPCAGQGFAATIYNRNNLGRMLAQCRLYFLTPDDKERLLSIAVATRQQDAAAADKDMAATVYGYALNHYGHIAFPQLFHWLQKMGAASTNGRH